MSPRLLINAVSIRIGGGLNDLCATLPRLTRTLGPLGWDIEAFVSPAAMQSLEGLCTRSLKLTTADIRGMASRAHWEYFELPRIVRDTRPDVVFHFANFVFRDLSVAQMTVLRSTSFFSPKYAAAPRRGLRQRLRYRLGRASAHRTIARADAIFCISQAQRRQLLAATGDGAQKVVVNALGIELPEAAAQLRGLPRDELARPLPPAAASQLNSASGANRLIVLNIAHHYTQKNLRTLLAAVNRLHRADPRVLLVLTAGMVASHRAADDAEIRAARDLAARGALLDLGPVERSSVWPLLAMADAFAFPSSVEAFGHPLLEAMAMGVPVVASDTDIHREICDDAAVFHSTYDAESLAGQLRRVLDDAGLRIRLVESGRRNITRFSWDAHVATLAEAIVALAGRGGS